MININKQITYWADSAAEDLEVGIDLLNNKKIRHALFFIHLTLEKILKAHVCKQTCDLAPKTHNLTRLAELSKISALPGYKEDFVMILSKINEFNLEGRYPDSLLSLPTFEEAQSYRTQAEEVYKWLITQLSMLSKNI